MIPRRAVLACAVTGALVLAIALPASAAPGDLDPTFSGDGRVRVAIDGGASGVAIQHDGKIVAVGSAGVDIVVVRLNRDGTLDHSFSHDGAAKIRIAGRETFGVAVAVRSGKIVVVGWSENLRTNLDALAILRLNSDGTLDHSFSQNGVVLFRVGDTTRGTAVAVQSDGRIVAGGWSDGQALVVRRLSNGNADTSFAGVGWVRQSFPTGISVDTMGIDPTTGRIVVGGTLGAPGNGGGTQGMGFVAYTRSGHLDRTFSGDGRMHRATSFAGGLGALTILPNGRIVAVGGTHRGQAGAQILVEKYTRSGDFDTSFGGGDGIFLFGFDQSGSACDDGASGVTAQADGKIVVVGSSNCTGPEFVVARLTAAGGFDPTFHGGALLTTFPSGDSQANAVAVNNATHKIVVVGDEITESPSIGTDAMLAARYLG